MELKRKFSLPALFLYTLLVSVLVVVMYQAFTARFTNPSSSLFTPLSRTQLSRQRSRRPHARALGTRVWSQEQSNQGPLRDTSPPTFLQRLQSLWARGLRDDVADDVITPGAAREIRTGQRKLTVKVSGDRREGSADGELLKPRRTYSGRSRDRTVGLSQSDGKHDNGEAAQDRSPSRVDEATAATQGATTASLSSAPGSSSPKDTQPGTRKTLKAVKAGTGTERNKNTAADRQEPKADPLLLHVPTAAELGVSGRDAHAVVSQLMKLNRCYLLRSFQGRLGNVLFELASAVCIALKNNLTLVVQDAPSMKSIKYRGVVLSKEAYVELQEKLPHQRHVNKANCVFDETLMTLRPAGSCSHRIGGYMQSWKYFEPCKQEVLRATAFTDDIVTRARAIVSQLREKLPGRTLVGVHVRMEDYLSARSISNGKRTAPPEYYVKAMTYFRKRFHDVTFVVLAKDPDNFRANVTAASDVTFLSRSDSPAVDLEVLSRLDHLVMSVGTFGWWAGYKGTGTVVCYRDFFTPGTRYANNLQHDAINFLYPGWVPL